jgi:hypothetical protein
MGMGISTIEELRMIVSRACFGAVAALRCNILHPMQNFSVGR